MLSVGSRAKTARPGRESAKLSRKMSTHQAIRTPPMATVKIKRTRMVSILSLDARIVSISFPLSTWTGSDEENYGQSSSSLSPVPSNLSSRQSPSPPVSPPTALSPVRQRSGDPRVRGAASSGQDNARGQGLTPTEHFSRQAALRHQIQPFLVTQHEIIDHLNATNYDVNAAYVRWQARHAWVTQEAERINRERRERVTAAQLEAEATERDGEMDTPDIPDSVQYRRFENPEQERSQAVNYLRTSINAGQGVEEPIHLSRSEATVLLEVADWDIMTAIDILNEQEGALGSVFRPFSRLRRTTEVVLEQDERLALLTSLTGRGDWWSLQQHLRRQNWDYVAAVAAWQKSGIPVLIHPKMGKGRDQETYALGMRQLVDGDVATLPEDNGQEEPIDDGSSESSDHWLMRASGDEDSHSSNDDSDSGDSDKNHKLRRGHLVDRDTDTARLGCPDPTKFIIEYFANEHYWSTVFRNKNFRWSNFDAEGVDDVERPIFNFNDQAHLDVLNAWRRQSFSRITGIRQRPASREWLPVEEDFIYELHRELYEELQREFPDVDPAELLPFIVTSKHKVEWTDRFNKQFAGTIQNSSDEPRPARKRGAIDIHRARMESIIRDFKVKRNVPRPPRETKFQLSGRQGRGKNKKPGRTNSAEEEEKPSEKKSKTDQKDGDDHLSGDAKSKNTRGGSHHSGGRGRGSGRGRGDGK